GVRGARVGVFRGGRRGGGERSGPGGAPPRGGGGGGGGGGGSEGGAGPALEGDRRLLLGARIAALVIRLQRARERGVRAFPAAPRPEAAHIRGQRQRVAEHADQRIQQGKARHQRDGEEQRRDFDPVGRIDQQDVARIDPAD